MEMNCKSGVCSILCLVLLCVYVELRVIVHAVIGVIKSVIEHSILIARDAPSGDSGGTKQENKCPRSNSKYFPRRRRHVDD